MIKKFGKVGWVILLAMGAVGGRTEEVNDRFLALEARQKALEEKLAAQPVVTAGKDGFGLKSADGNFGLKFYGDIQADFRFFLADHQGAYQDEFLIRRFRPTLEMAGFGKFTARLQPNLANNAVSLDDAYLDYKACPVASVRVGRYKPPVGFENLQSSVRLTFIERSLATNLVPIYDQGAQIYGGIMDGRFNYALSVSNGAPDGESVNSDSADGKEVSGRLFAQPWKGATSLLSDLGLGISGSSAHEYNTSLPAAYKTEGQKTSFFTYQYAKAKGRHQRISPHMSWYGAGAGLMGEYVISYQTVQSTPTKTTTSLAHKAWQVSASYVLTGETPSYKGLKPKADFAPSKGTWGALEVAGRVSRFMVDDKAFTAGQNISDSTKSAREARAFTGGLNWYMNSFVKNMVNYTYTSFYGGAASGDRVPERALFFRSQVAF